MYKLNRQEREFREKMRGQYPLDLAWYAVMTHCGREGEIRDRLSLDCPGHEGAEMLLPELKASAAFGNGKRRLPQLLFSSYVFLRCVMNDEVYMSVSSYAGVVQILGRAYRIPYAIADSEITHLKGVLASVPQPRLAARLNVGTEVVVTEGLMNGMRGRIVEVNNRHVKLETHFSFLDIGTSIVVVVPRDQVEPAGSGWPERSHNVLVARNRL